MIAPRRSNRKHHTQDRRPFAPLPPTREEGTFLRLAQNVRRLTVPWEHSLVNFVGMIHLACVIILMMHLGDGF
jgi:hypothetical protein